MFSALESQLGAFAGLHVLDLYAGSGALGLEALSRGAAHVRLVESDARAVQSIRSNLAVVRLPGGEVVPTSVERALATSPSEPYDLVLADPPYTLSGKEIAGTLARLAGGWLHRHAVVVVERPTRAEPLDWPDGLVAVRERRYGETKLWYGRPAG